MKWLVLCGLLINLIGVILLYFGMKVDKEGPSSYTPGEPGKSYLVRENSRLLKIGIVLICVGIILQFIGTCA
jgi:uncharacterized membrane protein